jgi:hypothetical protein
MTATLVPLLIAFSFVSGVVDRTSGKRLHGNRVWVPPGLREV